MQKEKTKEPNKYATISVLKKTKRKLTIERAKYGYTQWTPFFEAIKKILSSFKPELEEYRK